MLGWRALRGVLEVKWTGLPHAQTSPLNSSLMNPLPTRPLHQDVEHIIQILPQPGLYICQLQSCSFPAPCFQQSSLTPLLSHCPHPIMNKACWFHLQNASGIQPRLAIRIAATQIWAVITTYLDYCNSLLTGLPASAIALQNQHAPVKMHIGWWHSSLLLKPSSGFPSQIQILCSLFDPIFHHSPTCSFYSRQTILLVAL